MKKYSIIGISILALIFGILYTFRVGNISCRVQGETCPQAMEEKLNSLKGRSLFFTLFEPAIIESIADETILVVSMRKQLPNTLLLDFTREEPRYILQTDEKKYTVFSSGILHELPETATENEHHIFSLGFPLEKILEESYVLPNYHQALTVLSLSLYNPPFSLQNSKWDEIHTIQFTVSNGVNVLVPVESAEEKTSILQQILESSELESLPEPLTEIDLRYKYPVLRTTQ